VPTPSAQVRQALKKLQAQVRQKPAAGEEITGQVWSRRREPPVNLPLTRRQFDAMEDAERAIAADERFEHLDPARDLIREFALDCEADRQNDHVEAFMEKHGRDAIERICYFGVEHLKVEEPLEVAGIQLLPAGDPAIPEMLLILGKTNASYAGARVTGTNDVLMTARAREMIEHAFRVLRIGLRQSGYGLNPQQLRFRLGIAYAFADESGGGMKQHDDIAYSLELPPSVMPPVLATAVIKLPPTAPKKSINEKALLAVEWLDRAIFTADPLVATLFRFFALEALLGSKSDRLKNGPLALRQMTLSHVATGGFRTPDRTFLEYDEVRSYAVHGEVASTVTREAAGRFAGEVRDTLDQYLTVAKQQNFTKRSQLLNFLDTHPDRDTLIAWIRENGSKEWTEYLDSLTASPDDAPQIVGKGSEQDPPDPG
jgi:hypothetical protein